MAYNNIDYSDYIRCCSYIIHVVYTCVLYDVCTRLGESVAVFMRPVVFK